MRNLKTLNNNKFSNLSRNNSNSYKIYNNKNSVISKKEIYKDSMMDFPNERDFISQKLNRKYNRKLISKTITTTIKYEYKTSKNKYENNKIHEGQNYNKNDKCSTVLRSQSSILNKHPTDSFFDKNRSMKVKYEINNYNNKNNKYKNRNQIKKKKEEEKSSFVSFNKGFENFTLSKVCGASHPLKENNDKNNNNINTNSNNRNNINKEYNEYTFVKNYTLKYNYEENNNYIIKDNNNNIHKNKNKNENENKDNHNDYFNSYKMVDTKENSDNNNNNKNNNQSHKFLFPESSNIKLKKDKEIKSYSSNNIKTNEQINNNTNKYIQKKDENINDNTFYKLKPKKNKNNFLKNKIISNKHNKTYNLQKENGEADMKIKSNKHFLIHKNKSYFSRNNDKKLENSKINEFTYKYNKIRNNQLLAKIQNYNNEISKKDSKPNTFSEKTLNIFKKYGSKDYIKCIMPANNLRNILLRNENELFCPF